MKIWHLTLSVYLIKQIPSKYTSEVALDMVSAWKVSRWEVPRQERGVEPGDSLHIPVAMKSKNERNLAFRFWGVC